MSLGGRVVAVRTMVVAVPFRSAPGGLPTGDLLPAI